MVRFTLLENDITRNENTTQRDILDLVIATAGGVPKECAFSAPSVKLQSTRNLDAINRGDLHPTLRPKNTQVDHQLAFTSEQFQWNFSRMVTRRDKVMHGDRVGCGLSPVRMTKT